jgi:hypothetical protein
MPPLPPFPLQLLELPDEELAVMARVWAIAQRLQHIDIEVGGVQLANADAPPELLAAVLLEAAAMMRGKVGETDNVALTGLEKAMRLTEPDADGNVSRENLSRAGRMFRQFVSDRGLLLAAVDEAATGRRRQRARARKPRPDFLQRELIKLVKANPSITPLEALEELGQRVGSPGVEPRIDLIDHAERVVRWIEPGKMEQSAPFSGLRFRLKAARKPVKKKRDVR